MTTTASSRALREPMSVRLSRALLTRTVRGNAAEGTMWGEALLSELDEAATPGDSVRWTISGLPVAWRERRKRRAAARPPRPLKVRVGRRVVVALIVLLVGAPLASAFVATVHYEPSGSMQPTYAIGSRVLVDKIGYHLTGLHHGDIVLISDPTGWGPSRTNALKRVVGLPGDVIACNADGAVTRNGTIIASPPRGMTGSPCSTVTVSAGFVYVLGDNVMNSLDSRMFGPVDQSEIIGRITTKVWPL